MFPSPIPPPDPVPAPLLLLVDDEDDFRETLAELLQLEGYRVVTARHGRVALDWLAENERPRVIVFDLMMPVMDGWELAGALATDPRYVEIPRLAISAGDPFLRLPPLQVTHRFVKPVDVSELLGTLAFLTDSRGARAVSVAR